MNNVKSVKAAVIASQSVISLWLLLTLAVYLLQRQVQIHFLGGYFNTLTYEPIFIQAHIFQFSSFALVTTANCFILNKKRSFRFSPLIISSLALGFTVILSGSFTIAQQISIAQLYGADRLREYGNLASLVGTLSFLLYGGIVINIAAAAVYAYSKGTHFDSAAQNS